MTQGKMGKNGAGNEVKEKKRVTKRGRTEMRKRNKPGGRKWKRSGSRN